MIALLAMVKGVPSWCWWLLALVALCLGCEMHGRHSVQKKWDAYIVAEKIAAKEALDKRVYENKQLAAMQTATSTNIQKAYDDKIANLNAIIGQSKRLRVGSKFCPAPTGTPITKSTSSSNDDDTGSRVLSSEVDAAVKQLILETEEVAATARAAQEFIKANGEAP